MRSPKIVVSCLVLSAGFVLGAGLATTAAAQQPNGYPITDVNLRAGPGTEYPVILTVPADAPITILGCVPDYTWCDSVFQDRRGWMRSTYLSGYSEGDYYLLRDYAPDLGYRRVTFDIDAYWDNYYRDEPFYGDRGRWGGPREAGWVDDGVFYDRLSPHGSWTWIQGRYVWVPANVDRGWRPYTRGRWVYTDRGWTWVSNEPFGWATYHYGRWGFSDRVGWFWTPGNQWAPAWVSWRQSDDYLAWAPLPPAYDRGYERGYDHRGGGININISFGDVPDYYWSMVPSRDFLSDDLPRYYVNDRGRRRSAFQRTRPVGHTTIVNKTVVNNVVNVNYVEQKTQTKVVERRIARTDNAEQAGKVKGDTLEVYEPEVGESPEANAPPEPKDVETVAEASETKAQAEGEATTEDMLAPPEVQEAAKVRKGRKAEAEGAAEAEAVTKGDALPEGDIADTPPPAKAAKNAPVPAHEVAAPRGEEPSPANEKESDAAPMPSDIKPDTEAKDAAPKTAEPDSAGEPEKPKAEPKTEPKAESKPEPKPRAKKKSTEAETPAPKSAGENAGQEKTDKPSKKNAAPADKAPKPAETTDEAPPEPKQEIPAEAEKPAEAERPKALQDKAPAQLKPTAEEKPEAQPEPDVKKAEPEQPAPKTPEAQKPPAEPKAPEAPKKPEAKKPAPKKPEAKKAPPKPQAKKAAPQKHEAKQGSAKAKPMERAAQGPAAPAKSQGKGKKRVEKN